MTDVLITLKTLTKSLDELHKEQSKMKSELKDKDEKITELIKENAELKSRIGSMTQSNNALHWQGLSPVQPQNPNTLLIGSSIIRDVDENKLLNTKCICIPGGYVSDVKEAVAKFPTTNKMRHIVLVVGGNDCEGGKSNNLTPTTDILSKYEELIKCATEVSSSVVVSSVCPRSRGDAVLERIRALNAGLKVACDELGAEIVDNDPSFHLQDGNINDGYLLSDGVHLSRAATNKLINNLKLQLRHGETSAHHLNRRRRLAPQQAKDSMMPPDNVDGDLQHAFWQRARQNGTMRKHPGQQTHVFRPRVPHNVTGAAAGRPANAPSHASPFPAPSQANGHAVVPQPSPGHSGDAMTPVQAAPPPPPPAPRPHSYGQIRAPPSAGRANTHPPQTLLKPTRTNPRGSQNHRNFSHVPQVYHAEHQFCQLCHGAGHTAITCGSRESECFKCHQKGHLARACPQ